MGRCFVSSSVEHDLYYSLLLTRRYVALVRVENPQDMVACDSTKMQFRSDLMTRSQIMRWQRLKTAGWIINPQRNEMTMNKIGRSVGMLVFFSLLVLMMSINMKTLKITMLPAQVRRSPVSSLLVRARMATKKDRTQNLKMVPAKWENAWYWIIIIIIILLSGCSILKLRVK